MKRSEQPHGMDRVLLGAVMVLLILGILGVYSASSFRGAERYDDPAVFLKQHLWRVLFGLILLFIFSKVNYHRIRWITPMLMLILTLLLIGVLFGPVFQGSRRSFFLFGKQFQPSEFMKLTLICYLAAIFSKEERSRAFQTNVLMGHYLFVLVIIGLVFIEPDLGTSLVLFFMSFSMFYLAGVGWKQLLKMSACLIPIVFTGLLFFPYQRQRMSDFLNSLAGTEQVNYHVKQSIIGFAHGGMFGAGYGSGKQKLFFLPEPFSDFILASVGEELGFIGILMIFTLLGLLLWRGFRIAQHAPDQYGSLIAGGVTIMISINALINAGVALNLLPTTGLPFPFLSYGGSSLFAHLAGIGIMLNISRKTGISYRQFTFERASKKRRRS